MYYFVMGIIFNIYCDVDNFVIYLFFGIVIINFFNEGFGNVMNLIVDNGVLVWKIYFF